MLKDEVDGSTRQQAKEMNSEERDDKLEELKMLREKLRDSPQNSSHDQMEILQVSLFVCLFEILYSP